MTEALCVHHDRLTDTPRLQLAFELVRHGYYSAVVFDTPGTYVLTETQNICAAVPLLTWDGPAAFA